MSQPHRRARAAALLLAATTALGASLPAAGPAAAEQIPGPPARPGLEPIGGAALTGTTVLVRTKAGAAAPVPAPPVDAAAWLLADATTGEVLAAKAPHQRYRPASTLKTLTAVTLMPRLDPAATYTATQADARAEGSRVGIVPGATYTVDDLWHALLLPSANDAASALANANGGFRRTLAQMNAEARRLQAFDTVARTPSGLDADGQFTSAYDLALLARAALRTPHFVAVSHTMSYDFPGRPAKAGAKRGTYEIWGQNRLLNHGFTGTVAGKTGFTTEAGRTFWVAVKRGGRTLVATFLRIGAGTESTAEALMTWGFRYGGRLEPIGTLVDPDPGVPGPPPAPPRAAAAAARNAAVSTAGPGAQGGGLPLGGVLIVVIVAAATVLAVLRRRAVVRSRQRARTARERTPV